VQETATFGGTIGSLQNWAVGKYSIHCTCLVPTTVKSFELIGTQFKWFEDNGHVRGHLNSWIYDLRQTTIPF